MRHQDKLIRLHRSVEHHAFRRYVVREMDRIVAGFDSQLVVDHLLRAFLSPDPGEAFQAQLTLSRFLPRASLGRYTAADRELSIVVGSDPHALEVGASGTLPLRVVSELLGPSLSRFINRVKDLPDPARARAWISMTPYISQQLDDHLLSWALGHGSPGDASSRNEPSPLAAALVIQRCATTGVSEAILDSIAAVASKYPEHLLALSLPDPTAENGVRILGATRDAPGSGGIPGAIALEGLVQPARRSLFESLRSSRQGWILVHGLASLARIGDEDDLNSILSTLARFHHPILRVEAARSLGRVRTEAARDACRKIVTHDPSSSEAAAALDSLARQGLPDTERLAIFGAAFRTRSPEVYALACLGLVSMDPERAASGVARLLRGGPEARTHGLHVLAYLPGLEAARILAKFAVGDGDPSIRRQAATYLTYKSPSEDLALLLMDTLNKVDDALKPLVAMSLARSTSSPDSDLIELIEENASKASPATCRSLIEAIASTGLSDARDRIQAWLRISPDSESARARVLGALGGWATSGQRWKGLDHSGLADSPDPQIAAATSIALLQEDLNRSLSIIERLIGGDDLAFSHGILALETVGHIVGFCLSHPRYNDLVGTLRERGHEPDRPATPRGLRSAVSPVRTDLLESEGPQALLARSIQPAQIESIGREMSRSLENESAGKPRFTERFQPERRAIEALDGRLPTPSPWLVMVAVVLWSLALILCLKLIKGTSPPPTLRPPSEDFLEVRHLSGVVTAEGVTLGTGHILSLPIGLDARHGQVDLEFQSGSARFTMEEGSSCQFASVFNPDTPKDPIPVLLEFTGKIQIEILKKQRSVRIMCGSGVLVLGFGVHDVSSTGATLDVVSTRGRIGFADERGQTQVFTAPRELTIRRGILVAERAL